MFSITVKIDGIEKRRRSAGLLHIVIGFFLIVNASNYYRSIEYKTFWPVALFLLVASFSLFYGFFRRKIDLSAQFNYRLRLIQLVSFTALGFLVVSSGRAVDYLGVFAFAFLCIILLFSERKIFQETTIYINDTGVKVPGYYRDHLVQWENLSEVVVREDFITLFHVKQKYLQFQVMQDLSTLEVAKMNAFCREKIEGRRQRVEGETLNPKPSTLNPKP